MTIGTGGSEGIWFSIIQNRIYNFITESISISIGHIIISWEQFKRGLLSNLPGLRAGEPGFTTDKYDLYVGIDSTTSTNQFVGSGRFWTVEQATRGSGVNLVEGTDNGTDYVTLAAPASVGAAVTYIFPAANGTANTVLTNDGSGNLSWGAGSNNSTMTGITTISGQLDITGTTNISGITTVTDATDNTLGNADTGAFQIDGGLGVNKNVTIGANLHVAGYSEFVGVATFKGGTINLGDADTDDINVGGEFVSSLVPDATKTYDLGESAKQWRDVYAGGSLYGTESLVGTASSTRVDYAVTVASKTADHRYFGSGSGSGYFIDGIESPFITLLPGKTYRFDQSDGSNSGHPLLLYLESDKTNNYTTNVTTTGTPGNAGAYTEITVGDETPTVLHYQCSAHALMGNSFATNSNVVNSNFDATLRGNLTLGTSTAVNAILDEDNMASDSATSLATQQSIKAYVDSQVTAQDLDVAGDSGTGAVDLDSQSLTIAGTANEVETSAANQTVTIGLPATVNITTELNVPTVDTGAIRSANGTAAITIADTTAQVAIGQTLQVGGDLIVLGSQSIVNTETLSVEDSLIEVGMVNSGGSLVPPSSDANIDVGLVMHYHDGTDAKKAAVFWDDSAGRIVVGADVSETSSVMTTAAYADFEIKGLFVNDCAGASQVISCTGTTRSLENITVDGGSF